MGCFASSLIPGDGDDPTASPGGRPAAPTPAAAAHRDASTLSEHFASSHALSVDVSDLLAPEAEWCSNPNGSLHNSRCSSPNGSSKGHLAVSVSVSARALSDLMTKQGVVRRSISRQLSSLSRYSIASSEGGALIIGSMHQLEDVKLGKQIGSGGFSKVYEAEYQGQPVAVKVVTSEERPANADRSEPVRGASPMDRWHHSRKEQSMELESLVMTAVDHPNVVKTHKVLVTRGAEQHKATVRRSQLSPSDAAASASSPLSTEANSFCAHIIMELCDSGTLLQGLLVNRCFHDVVKSAHTGWLVRWDAWGVLETLKEITSALLELEKLHIVHGDLKPLNIMLTSSSQDRRGFVSKLTDFGLARVLQPGQRDIQAHSCGTVTHMSPELLLSGVMSLSQDVYAIGIIMWECFCAEVVYKGLKEPQIVEAVTLQQLRPTFPADTPPRYRQLAERCWAEQPDQRPALPDLYEQLCMLQSTLSPAGAESPSTYVILPTCPASTSRSTSGNSVPGGCAPAAAPAYLHRHQLAHCNSFDHSPLQPPLSGPAGHIMQRQLSLAAPADRRTSPFAAMAAAVAAPSTSSPQLQPPPQQLPPPPPQQWRPPQPRSFEAQRPSPRNSEGQQSLEASCSGGTVGSGGSGIGGRRKLPQRLSSSGSMNSDCALSPRRSDGVLSPRRTSNPADGMSDGSYSNRTSSSHLSRATSGMALIFEDDPGAAADAVTYESGGLSSSSSVSISEHLSPGQQHKQALAALAALVEKEPHLFASQAAAAGSAAATAPRGPLNSGGGTDGSSDRYDRHTMSRLQTSSSTSSLKLSKARRSSTTDAVKLRTSTSVGADGPSSGGSNLISGISGAGAAAGVEATLNYRKRRSSNLSKMTLSTDFQAGELSP